MLRRRTCTIEPEAWQNASRATNRIRRLVRAEPRIDQAYSRFLANAYEVKSIADYGTEPASVTSESTDATIDTAERMIDSIATLLGETDATST